MSLRMKRSQPPLAVCSGTGYSNVERMLAAAGSTPLLVNLESMTSKPNAGGDSKDCVEWKVEKAVHYFVTTDSSSD